MDEKPRDSTPSIELTMIRNTLEQAHHDKARAARLLGISQSELQRRMQQYGLPFDGAPEE
jgi:transcriptional regulator with PAS, ATPase and Fis domain